MGDFLKATGTEQLEQNHLRCQSKLVWGCYWLMIPSKRDDWVYHGWKNRLWHYFYLKTKKFRHRCSIIVQTSIELYVLHAKQILLIYPCERRRYDSVELLHFNWAIYAAIRCEVWQKHNVGQNARARGCLIQRYLMSNFQTFPADFRTYIDMHIAQGRPLSIRT